MNVIVSAGNRRKVVSVANDRDARREAANAIKHFLFPNNGAYHQAKRRGERALAGGVA